MPELLPISAVVATKNRAQSLQQTLESLAVQSSQPAEIIVVDASLGEESRRVCETVGNSNGMQVRWMLASISGAAAQRNQGVAEVEQSVVWFFDDDIHFKPECLRRLWLALESDPRLGGVNAMIVNQCYQSPGWGSRSLFRILHGRAEATYAGRVVGPAVNLLPEDRDDLPDVVPVDWLSTTCTLYRREALPEPPFDAFFTGYSMMEDLTLSLRVGQKWNLANARTSHIFHDNQPAPYKSDLTELSRMELVNRHYVMTKIQGKIRMQDYARLWMWEAFQLAASAVRQRLGRRFWSIVRGKLQGLRRILNHSQNED